MTSLPLAASSRASSSSHSDSRGGKRRGRLVEDEHGGVAGQRLGDLDDLPLGKRQAADLLVGAARGKPVALEERQRLRPAAPARAPCASGDSASRRNQMFCSTVRSGMSESSWNTAEMPARLRGARIGGEEGCPAEEDAALVGPDRAGEDLDEGAFSGAVLADQRVDLAGLGVELGARQRGDAAVALRNCRGFEQAHIGLRKEKRRPAMIRCRGAAEESLRFTSRPLLRR